MIIFCGPTIQPDKIPVPADVRKPAAQGDIAAAATEHPGETLVLIDGYFRQELAPWHKEVLYAMQEKGCRFVGGGSLGAIRAVECEPWGAEPVGQIAQWYKDGTIIDDGEVALLHEAGGQYRGVTVPLVNLRASGCTDIAKVSAIPFEERTWEKIARALGDEEADKLRTNYVDQKFLDAQAAILAASLPKPAKQTIKAHNLGSILFTSMLGADMPTDGVRPYTTVPLEQRLGTIQEHMLLHLCDVLGIKPTRRDINIEADRMWNRLGSPSPEDFDRWMAVRNITHADWWERAEEEAKLTCLVKWQEACELGIDAVAKTIKRRKFYQPI
jgi:hypothetical protein